MTNSITEKGGRLREIINHTDLTQKKFADKAGIPSNYLTGIVNGFKDLSGGVLEKIAETYGEIYNIGWLLSGKGDMLLNSVQMPPNLFQPEELKFSELQSRLISLENKVEKIEKQLK